jgi:tetratricopeptide (TPR) repeat protein
MPLKKALFVLPFVFLFSCNPTPKITVLNDAQQAQLKNCVQAVNEGRFKDAMGDVHALFDIEHCRTPETYYYRGFLSDKAEGDQQKALAYYKSALGQLKEAKDPSRNFLEATINFYAAYSSALAGNQDESSTYLNSALVILESLEKSGRLDQGAGNYYLGYCYAKKGAEDMSLDHYKAAIRYFKENNLTWYLKAGAMFNIGLYYYNRADYPNAQEWWQMANVNEPDEGYFKNDYTKWLAIVKAKNTIPAQ